MLRPCYHARIQARLFSLFFLWFCSQSAPEQSRLCCAAPAPTPSCANAAASLAGTNCCPLPYPPPAARPAHFALLVFSFLATRHSLLVYPERSRRAAQYQSVLRQLASPSPFALPDKTPPPHTSHSCPSAPRPASSAPPPPR